MNLELCPVSCLWFHGYMMRNKKNPARGKNSSILKCSKTQWISTLCMFPTVFLIRSVRGGSDH